MAVTCRREGTDRGLSTRVREDLAAAGVALYDGLAVGAAGVNQDYGGNIEVSPPVRVETPAMARDPAGPSVPRHPPAPLGKIIFGDCSPRPAERETREFLLAQRVQPVLPIDTSWLAVGHVDELMCTVPDRRRGGFKLAMASTRAMTLLLQGAAQVAPPARTALHRGKYSRSVRIGSGPSRFVYLELEVEHLLDAPVDRLPNPAIVRYVASAPSSSETLRAYNERLQLLKLDPIQERLERGLGVDPAAVIPIPVYFRLPTRFDREAIAERHRDHMTATLTVDCANLQVVNGHLLIPRPYGPRVPRADARRIVGDVLTRLGRGDSVQLGPSATVHWSYPGEPNWKVFAYFARTDTSGRARIRDAVERDDPSVLFFSERDALERARTDYFSALGGSNDTATTYRRLEADEGTVDVVESYLLSVLQPLGLTVHFVDSWFYHTRTGSVHCGTNLRHTPPPVRWWDDYDPVGPQWRYRPDR